VDVFFLKHGVFATKLTFNDLHMHRMNNEESLHGVGHAPSSGRGTLLTNAMNTKVLIVYVARDVLQVVQVSAVGIQYIIHQNVFFKK